MLSSKHSPDLAAAVSEFQIQLSTPQTTVLPSKEQLSHARSQLLSSLPEQGLSLPQTLQHLSRDIAPALNASSQSANYYGFVTGGATPAAAFADNMVTTYDQNVQVHLPDQTVATDVEAKALRLLAELLRLNPDVFPHRTFTTGATASNIMGLALGREYVLQMAAKKHNRTIKLASVGELGLVEAMKQAGVQKIKILTSAPHSSLSKAASVVGLGTSSVHVVGREHAPHKLNLARVREELEEPGVVGIVAVSMAEVNTGFFATSGFDLRALRETCDEYNAWIHVDAAFGALGRVLDVDDMEYDHIVNGCWHLDLANSITGDGHKLLNVPYDCGFLFSGSQKLNTVKLAMDVFRNPGAAYLGGSFDAIPDIPSPLHIGIENSRRFRALPVYANLISYSRDGYRDMLERQIGLSRRIAEYIYESPNFDLLPRSMKALKERLAETYIVVLFRAKSDELNKQLVKRINSSRKIYVSGTAWDGELACRFAVSNWQVDIERDLKIIKEVLDGVLVD